MGLLVDHLLCQTHHVDEAMLAVEDDGLARGVDGRNGLLHHAQHGPNTGCYGRRHGGNVGFCGTMNTRHGLQGRDNRALVCKINARQCRRRARDA
jgi:hypothetical protein